MPESVGESHAGMLSRSRSAVDAYREWTEDDSPFLQTVSVLLERSETLDLNRSDILIAVELVQLESDCSDRKNVLLLLTILSSLVSKRRGSTRFAITGEGTGDRTLQDRLRLNLSGLYEILAFLHRKNSGKRSPIKFSRYLIIPLNYGRLV